MSSIDEYLYGRANKLMFEDRLEEALREFRALKETVSDIADKDFIALSEFSCLNLLGQFAEAKQVLDEIGRTLPEQVDFQIAFQTALADLDMAQNNKEAALAGLDRILSKHPDLPQHPDLRRHYEMIQERRGILLSDLRRFSESIPILEEVLPFRQDRATILFHLGFSYCGVDRLEEADDKLSEALRLGLHATKRPFAHYALGVTCFELKHYERAKEQFELCAQIATSEYIKSVDLWRWLQATCRHLGLKDEANHYAQLARPS